MKKIILIGLLTGIVTLSFGQWNFENAGPFNSSTHAYTPEIPFLNNIISTNSQGMYRWKLVPNFAAGWEAFVCDKNLCWPTGTYQADFQLNVSDTAILDTKVKPNGIGASGSFEMFVYEIADSVNTVQSFIANINTSISNIDNGGLISAQIKIYPNPTNNYLKVEANDVDFDFVSVVNVIGEEVINTMEISTPVDVSMLDSGLYMIRFMSNDSGMLATKAFSKL